MKKNLFRKIDKIVRLCAHFIQNRFPPKVEPQIILIEGPWGLPDDNSGALLESMIEAKVHLRYRIFFWVSNAALYQDRYPEEVTLLDTRTFIHACQLYRIAQKAALYLFSNMTSPAGIPRDRQRHIYLSHGIPLKFYAGFKHCRKVPDIPFLSLSDFASSLWQNCNHLPLERFYPLGFPRNDWLLTPRHDLSLLKFDRARFDKIVVWMPTFRTRKRDRLIRRNVQAGTQSEIPLFNTPEKLAALDRFCTQNRIGLILKLHSAQDLDRIGADGSFESLKVMTTLQDLAPAGVRNYELLAYADALITDYSSVAFDYLLLDRPIGYVVDDLDSYRKEKGFAVENPLDLMPGEKIRSRSDFFTFLKVLSNGTEGYGSERRRLCEKIHRFKDAGASARLLRYLNLFPQKDGDS